jgi:hypothetical protein
MPTLTILTNASQGTDITIRDMGIIIANSGGSETFTDTKNLKSARKSVYLRTLVIDDAHGANSSTLILNNGTDNITQSEALAFLDSLDVPLRHNSAASTPGVNDDSADGYSVGSRWVNTTTDNEYVCLDNTLGAARWDVGGFNNNNAITIGANSTITTTSQSFVTITGMSITPGAGTYWVTYSCSSSYNKNAEAIHLGIFSGTNTAEVTEVTTIADVGGNLGGTYFNICAPGDVNTVADDYDLLFYVWINTGGSTDPAPAGRTGIEVTITANDTANTVASAVQTAVNANANFTASVTTNVVTITCVEARAIIPAADINTGFTVNVTTEGSPHSASGAFREIGGQSGNFGNPNCQGEITVATDTDFLEARWGITNNGGGGTGTMALGRVLYAVRIS